MNNQNMWHASIFLRGREDKVLHEGLAWKDCMMICINVLISMSIDYCQKMTQTGYLARYRERSTNDKNEKLILISNLVKMIHGS